MIIVFLPILIAGITLVCVYRNISARHKTVEYMNNNSNIGLVLLDDVTERFAPDEVGNDHPAVIYSEDNRVKGYGFRYPSDKSETVKITQIRIADDVHNILGITCGSSVDNAIKLLENDGFKLDAEESNDSLSKLLYERDSVTVTVVGDADGLVTELKIAVSY